MKADAPRALGARPHRHPPDAAGGRSHGDGSGRLEEPINRYRVTAVFHGHAHRGAPEGRTSTGIPVYNVSMPLLSRINPDRPPYLVVELPLHHEPTRPGGQPPTGTLAEPIVKSA